MEYDGYGNITAKNEDVYTYDNAKWKDLLTKVGNQTITYDAQGNPTSYLGHTLVWEKGRQLKSFDTNTYTYNANGIRTSKTVNGITHTYTLDGTKILKEVWGNNTLIPLYDNEDSVCGIEYNGTAYWFYKNLQGDIINIANADGNVIANYNYDAWGRLCSIIDTDGNAITDSTSIAIINPFRYRGYYYDTEIGMYYLQSRYYDPTAGRFINADMPEIGLVPNITAIHNLFAYCNNNSINLVDKKGYISETLALGFIIVAFVTLTILTLWTTTEQFKKDWENICQAIGNGLAWLGNTIVNGLSSVWNWTRARLREVVATIEKLKTRVKAHERVISRVKSQKRKKYNFSEIWFDRIGAPVLGKMITSWQAIKRAKAGLNSITYFSSDARRAAAMAGNAKPVHHQRHGSFGYFNHYHINGYATSAHIYYIIAG